MLTTALKVRTTAPTPGRLTLRGVVPLEPKASEPPPQAAPAVQEPPAPPEPPPSVVLLGELRARWPALFAADTVKPLVSGVHRLILAEMPEVHPDVLGAALGLHTRSGAYQAAILEAGTPRYGLDGELCGEVTEEQVERLKASRIRDAERRHQRFLEQQQHKGAKQ